MVEENISKFGYASRLQILCSMKQHKHNFEICITNLGTKYRLSFLICLHAAIKVLLTYVLVVIQLFIRYWGVYHLQPENRR